MGKLKRPRDDGAIDIGSSEDTCELFKYARHWCENWNNPVTGLFK